MIENLFAWWALLAVMGLALLPLADRIFPAQFRDRGRAFAKPLALIALTDGAWLLTNAGISHTVSLAIAALALTTTAVFAWRGFSGKWRAAWFREEATFLAALALFAFLRALQPSVFGAEKYMDFAIFNTLLRAEHFPPQDPWMSGVPINYYYFGYLLFADLTRLTGVAPAVAYNLSLATIGAMIFVGALSIGTAVSGKVWGGALAGIALVGIGNLDGARQLLVERKPLLSFDYWRSSRVVEHTINEFPFFSLLHGDLHPHVSALVINVTIVAVALAVSLTAAETPRLRPLLAKIALLGWLLAVLALTNPWDLPVSFTLLAVLSFHRLWSEKHVLRAALGTAAIVASLAIIMVVLSLPFTLNFHAQYHGVGQVHARTALVPFLTVFGFLLLPPIVRLGRETLAEFAEDPRLRDLVFACAAFAAVALYIATEGSVLILMTAVVILSLLTLLGPIHDTPVALAVALTTAAATALAACEVVFLRDPYGGELHRMNTVFKLYFQAWLLLALAFPAFVVDLFERPGMLWRSAAATVLLGGLTLSLCYPMGAIAVRWPGPDRRFSLDGLAYLDREHPGDAAAIRWLAATTRGTPVVLEATGDPYSYFGRVSANTGLPAVLGWANHEGVWRGADARIAERRRDVESLFRDTDVERARRLLARYRVRYVFVGDLERERFNAEALDKFTVHPELFERAYRSGTTEVFAVRETMDSE